MPIFPSEKSSADCPMAPPRAQRWTECLPQPPRGPAGGALLIGVLPGEGIGPEVIAAALEVLHAVAAAAGLRVEVRTGGPIGRDAEQTCGAALPPPVIQFCADVFARGGAILNGPGGGRYVYDLRKQFDLFFKISPLCIANGVPEASRLRPEALHGTDILLTRENTGGIYQGNWREQSGAGRRLAEHHLAYTEQQVQRFLQASARLARQRRGRLTVVWKEAGLPSISRLWRDCAARAAEEHAVHWGMVDVDLMAYRLIQEAPAFDVIAAPNLFGDVLADLGAVLLGSRGLSFSGNFGPGGQAVYQTNHGAAHDLAGSDRANPVGQVLSLAMLLRESFSLHREADAVEEAVRSVHREGWRTADVAVPGCRLVGTRALAQKLARKAGQLLQGRTRATEKGGQAA